MGHRIEESFFVTENVTVWQVVLHVLLFYLIAFYDFAVLEWTISG